MSIHAVLHATAARGRSPLTLLHSESAPTRADALRREHQLKAINFITRSFKTSALY